MGKLFANTAKYGGGKLTALWRQGWHEIPEVMGSSFYGLLGLIGIFYVNHRYFKEERYNRRYKTTLQIYRPEDERVPRIKRFEDSPQPTTIPGGLAGGSKC